tara:strand:+ start:228 stop:458 length:231 start_codon:yes stop_codon:yes gene_type:complete
MEEREKGFVTWTCFNCKTTEVYPYYLFSKLVDQEAEQPDFEGGYVMNILQKKYREGLTHITCKNCQERMYPEKFNE